MTTVDSGIQCQAVSGPGTMSTPVIPSPYAGVFGLALGRKSLKAACTILSPPGVEFSHHVRWTFSKIHADLSEGPGPSAGVGLDVDGPQAPLPASAKPSPLMTPFPITCGAPPVPHHATQGGLCIHVAHPGHVSLSCAFCILGEGPGVTAAHA